MAIIFSAKVTPDVINVTSAAAGFGGANLNFESLARPWKSTSTATQQIEYVFTGGKAVAAIHLHDCNFTTADLYVWRSGGGYDFAGTIITYANKEGRRRCSAVIDAASCLAFTVIIPAGASTDGQPHKRVGSLYAFAASSNLPPGPEWGYNAKWVIPQISTQLANGKRARALTTTAAGCYHLFTAKVKPFGFEDWAPALSALNSGICLLAMNLPEPRQWQSWPVRLDNEEINDISSSPGSSEFDLVLREIV